MVRFEDWVPYYNRILRTFHFSREEDEASARLLSRLLPRPRLTVQELNEMLQGKTVYIFGAHEDVEEGIEHILERGIKGVFFAADGACSALRTKGLRPDLIITDLDGRPEDLLYWNDKGIPLVVHAHGDNMESIGTLTPRFTHCMCTTQSRPFDEIYNFGGFTDGDRCVFLADHFGAFRIVLLGFDFSRVGKYSFTTDPEMKLRKLNWARRLISLFEVEYR